MNQAETRTSLVSAWMDSSGTSFLEVKKRNISPSFPTPEGLDCVLTSSTSPESTSGAGRMEVGSAVIVLAGADSSGRRVGSF